MFCVLAYGLSWLWWAPLLLGLIWAFWHLPIIFIGLNYPNQHLWAALPVFFVNVVLLAFASTWLRKREGGARVDASLLQPIYFFKSAVQLTTSVMGEEVFCSTAVLTRKRWPSAVAS